MLPLLYQALEHVQYVRQEGVLLINPKRQMQVRQEGALLQKRAEAAEAELAAQRAAHRRDLRRSARELADAQARPSFGPALQQLQVPKICGTAA